jgi:hypothetical protein
MRAIAAASVLSVCALGATGIAQSNRPDFSGQWRLVQPTPSELAQETLIVVAPDELLIRQTPRELFIEHPSKSGTHPETGTFEYGSGGFIGDLPGSLTPLQGRWGVSYIGTQLMISRSTTYPPDARGARSTVARGSMWRLEAPNRLVIEFGEERAGERPKIATRTYRKVTPQ